MRELSKAGISYIGYDVLRQAGHFFSGHITSKKRLRNLIRFKFSRNPEDPPLKNIDEFQTWDYRTRYNIQGGLTPNDVMAHIWPKIGWACSRYYWGARMAAAQSGRKFTFGGFKRAEWRKQVMKMSRISGGCTVRLNDTRCTMEIKLRYKDDAYADAGDLDINKAIRFSLQKYMKNLEKRLEKTTI